MRLQVRPGLRRAWRRPDRLQVGLDPRHGVVLDGLTAADETLLAALTAGTTLPGLLALASRAGVPEHRASSLVEELRAGGLLRETSPGARPVPLPGALRRRLAADADALAASLPDGDGWAVLAARRARCVAVVGAGRTGLAVALGLATAGVGCVLVEDGTPVRVGDEQPGGYTAADVGRSRQVAARELLARRCPDTRTAPGARTAPDLVVVVGHGPLDPGLGDRFVGEDLAHLAVVWGERDVAVGPLVLPGASGCLRCQHLHRTDRDPEWPLVVAQLGTRPPAGGGRAEEGSMATLAAALATGQVLAHLDEGAVPTVVDAVLEASLPDRGVALRAWPPHPACGCIRLPEVAVSPPAGTMAR